MLHQVDLSRVFPLMFRPQHSRRSKVAITIQAVRDSRFAIHGRPLFFYRSTDATVFAYGAPFAPQTIDRYRISVSLFSAAPRRGNLFSVTPGSSWKSAHIRVFLLLPRSTVEYDRVYIGNLWRAIVIFCGIIEALSRRQSRVSFVRESETPLPRLQFFINSPSLGFLSLRSVIDLISKLLVNNDSFIGFGGVDASCSLWNRNVFIGTLWIKFENCLRIDWTF